MLPSKDMFKSTRLSKAGRDVNLPILLRGRGKRAGGTWQRNGLDPFSKLELEGMQRDLDKAMAQLVMFGPGSDGERRGIKSDGSSDYTDATVQRILQQMSFCILDHLHAHLLEVPPFVQVLGASRNAVIPSRNEVETDAAATQLCLTQAFQGTAGGRIALPGHAEWEMAEWSQGEGRRERGAMAQTVHHAPRADVNDQGVDRTCGLCKAS